MRCVSAVFVLVLLAYGACESPTNSTEGGCEVKETTAICGEVFSYPEDVRITRIVVRSSKLTKIEKNDLTKYENLETLDVSNCGLLHIDHDAFTSNQNLLELNLSGNKDIQIPAEEPFVSSKSLTHLNLSHIAITDLPETVFTNLPNLEVIDLTSTTLKNFSSLSSLENLQTLIISEDANLNKTLLCHETHLHNITEIENDKRTTFNCNEEITEIKNTSQPEPAVTTLPIVPESPKKEEKEEEEKETTVEPETEPPKTEIITTNTSTAENLKEDTKPEPSKTENTTEPVTLKEDDPSKDNVVEPKKVEVLIPETETEVPTTEDAIQGEDNNSTNIPTTDNALDSIIQFSDISTNEEKTHGDIKKENEPGITEGNSEAVMPAPSSSESSGVNIVLGIILCVMIVGALGFGYKYWKNRRGGYTNANTEDVEEGKELQNMASHRAANGEPEQN